MEAHGKLYSPSQIGAFVLMKMKETAGGCSFALCCLCALYKAVLLLEQHLLGTQRSQSRAGERNRVGS